VTCGGAPFVDAHVGGDPTGDPGEGGRRREDLVPGRLDVLLGGVDDRSATAVVEESGQQTHQGGQAGVGTLHRCSWCRWWMTSATSSSSAAWAAGANPGKVMKPCGAPR